MASYWDLMLQAALLPCPPSPSLIEHEHDLHTSHKCLKVHTPHQYIDR